MHTLIKLFSKAEGNDLQITQVNEHVFFSQQKTYTIV